MITCHRHGVMFRDATTCPLCAASPTLPASARSDARWFAAAVVMTVVAIICMVIAACTTNLAVAILTVAAGGIAVGFGAIALIEQYRRDKRVTR